MLLVFAGSCTSWWGFELRQRGQRMWLDKLVPVFLVKHVFPGGTCVYKSLSIFRQIPIFINQHKTHVFSRTNEIWFFICALGATCKILFDQLVLISLLFNELTCLSCMTLSSDCISTNFDYRDSRNVKIKKKLWP